MSKVKPLAGIKLKENRILIKKHDLITKTEGGIILPDDDQIQPVGGVIVAVGPDTNDKLAKVGDNVRYLEHGQQVEIGKETYYLLRDDAIWGLVEEKK